ncbi:hypothetical protein MKX03_009445 [Papaver bracteatum]|nr:hypothetical protein MKX03_009445 [Papaver bracteatum]
MASRRVVFIIFIIACSDISSVIMVTNADPFGLCSHDANIGSCNPNNLSDNRMCWNLCTTYCGYKGECRIADGKQVCHCKFLLA